MEEEVKHVLKVYYKHRDIDKEEYKNILRRAVPQVGCPNCLFLILLKIPVALVIFL